MSRSPLRSKLLVDLVGFIIIFIYGASRPSLAGDPGVGWHLKVGEWIATNHEIPLSDPFLSTSVGKPWIANQWLSDLIFHYLYSWGQWPLLTIFALMICIIAYLVIVPASVEREPLSGPVLILGLLVITMLGAMQWMIRPVIFSFLLFSFVWSLLQRQKVSKLDFLAFPIIFIFWANLHPGFAMGLILIGLKAVLEKETRTHYDILLVLSLLATLVNPFGIELHKSIFGLVNSNYFMSLNQEWLSPDFHSAFFQPLLIAICILMFGLWCGARVGAFNAVTALIFLILSLKTRRYIPFFAIAGSAAIFLSIQAITARALQRFSKSRLAGAFIEPANNARLRGALPLVGIILLALNYYAPGAEIGPQKYRPAKAIDAIELAHSNGAIFHSPNLGGYITLRLWPNQRAWIDDRNELNGEELYEEYFAVEKLRPNWHEILNKYAFEWIVMETPSPLITTLKSSEEWLSVYEDKEWIVFRRKESA